MPQLIASNNNTNETQMLNKKLSRYVNIPQVCKKELKEYCPQNLYPTKQKKFECLSNKIDIFSSKCRYYVVKSKDFHENCYKDIEAFCAQQRNSIHNFATYEKNCSETLIKKYQQLTSDCANYIIGYNSRNVSTKTIVRDILKNKNLHKTTRYYLNNQQPKLYVTKNNTRELYQNEYEINNGNYTAEDIKNINTKVVLTNGVETNMYEMARFNKKYASLLERMNEEERNQFINKYFEKHKKKK